MTAAAPALPEILRQQFSAAMTKDAAFAMRDSLVPATNGAMVVFLSLAMMDRDTMVRALRDVAEKDSVDESLKMVEAMMSVRENIERVLEIATMAQARVIVTAHEALGIEWEDDDTGTIATAEALA